MTTQYSRTFSLVWFLYTLSRFMYTTIHQHEYSSIFNVVMGLTNTRLLVGGLEHLDYFSIQLGRSSSQLTFTPSFFRGVGLNHQPGIG